MRTHDLHNSFFERLTECLERFAPELGQLVEKEHSVVRQADFAGPGRVSSADHSGGGRAGVRAAERAFSNEPGWRLLGGQGMDLRDRNRFLTAELRQEPRQAARKHRLAGAGRTDEKQVVPAGGSHFQSALGPLVAPYVAQVRRGRANPAAGGGGEDRR